MTTSSGAGTPKLTPSLVNRSKFLGLFYEPESTALAKKSTVHLHVLRIDGGELALADMYRELANASLGYVLSRQNLAKISDDPSKLVEVVNRVQGQFRQPDANNGEGGELLLYAFLEGHLGAPKILSKMELKTATNHYVYGADGVHLLEIDEDNYQLIFGESKMYGDAKGKPNSALSRAIKAAFESISTLRDDDFDIDTWLVESELLKEAFDPELFDKLVSILIPSTAGPRRVTAFGVLLGFEVDVTDRELASMDDDEIESDIRQTARDMLAGSLPLISSEIDDRGLGGFHFHIYALPFLKSVVGDKTRGMENVRIDLAASLRNDRKK